MATTSPNDMLRMRVDGYKEGFSDGLASVLDWLEVTYLDVEETSSPKGQATLQLARDLSAAMRESDFGKKRRAGKESPTQ